MISQLLNDLPDYQVVALICSRVHVESFTRKVSTCSNYVATSRATDLIIREIRKVDSAMQVADADDADDAELAAYK